MVEEYKKITKDAEFAIIIGSSLGGFMALHLASLVHSRVVLFNPSIQPETTLKKFIGTEMKLLDGTVAKFSEKHVKKYAEISKKTDEAMDILRSSACYILLFVTDDPVIDNSVAVKKCKENGFSVYFLKQFKEHRLNKAIINVIKTPIIDYHFNMSE